MPDFQLAMISFEEKNTHHKNTAFFLFAGLAVVIAVGIFLATASPASAQCGLPAHC